MHGLQSLQYSALCTELHTQQGAPCNELPAHPSGFPHRRMNSEIVTIIVGQNTSLHVRDYDSTGSKEISTSIS